MNTHRPHRPRWAAALLCGWAAFAFGTPTPTPAPAPTPVPPRPARAVIIVLDGARPDALLLADAPHVRALAARGAASWEAQTVVPSVTLIAHASLLSGLQPDVHGLLHNNFSTDVFAPPTLLAAAADAGYATCMVTGKNRLEQLRQRPATTWVFALEGDRSVTDAALAAFDDGCAVGLVSYPNPDYFGHSTGWMSQTYLYELTNTDRQVGRLLAALEDGHTLVIVTADHGGHGTVHGSAQPEDVLIPWVIAGPGVVPGTALANVRITDSAFTLAWALGLPLPDGDGGQVQYGAFAPPQSTLTATQTPLSPTPTPEGTRRS